MANLLKTSPTRGSWPLYYSSLQGDDGVRYSNEVPEDERTKPSAAIPKTPTKKRDEHSSPSPRKRVGSASSSLSRAMSTSIHWANTKMKSFVPKRLLNSQCLTPTAIKNDRRSGVNDTFDEDDVTPMMFYVDDDAVAKKEADNELACIDPFAFEDKTNALEDEKKSHDELFGSPTSVIPRNLFPKEEVNNEKNHNIEDSKKKDYFFFDCPFPSRKLNFEENSSIDLSETIKSINAESIKEEIKAIRKSTLARTEEVDESLELWLRPELSWDGFANSPDFKRHEWDPECEEIAFGSPSKKE